MTSEDLPHPSQDFFFGQSSEENKNNVLRIAGLPNQRVSADGKIYDIMMQNMEKGPEKGISVEQALALLDGSGAAAPSGFCPETVRELAEGVLREATGDDSFHVTVTWSIPTENIGNGKDILSHDWEKVRRSFDLYVVPLTPEVVTKQPAQEMALSGVGVLWGGGDFREIYFRELVGQSVVFRV